MTDGEIRAARNSIELLLHKIEECLWRAAWVLNIECYCRKTDTWKSEGARLAAEACSILQCEIDAYRNDPIWMRLSHSIYIPTQSPMPWTFDGEFINDYYRNSVCRLVKLRRFEDRVAPNGALIVSAVNSFSPLVKACVFAQQKIPDVAHFRDVHKELKEALSRVIRIPFSYYEKVDNQLEFPLNFEPEKKFQKDVAQISQIA